MTIDLDPARLRPLETTGDPVTAAAVARATPLGGLRGERVVRRTVARRPPGEPFAKTWARSAPTARPTPHPPIDRAKLVQPAVDMGVKVVTELPGWVDGAHQVTPVELRKLVPPWLHKLTVDLGETSARPFSILTGPMSTHPLAFGRRVSGLVMPLGDLDVICLDRSPRGRQWAELLAHEVGHLQHPKVHDIRDRAELDCQERFATQLQRVMFHRHPRTAGELRGLSQLVLRNPPRSTRELRDLSRWALRLS